MPEARALVGIGDIHKIVEVAKAIVADSSLRIVQVSAVPDDHIDEVQPRLATGVGASAYLKIAEGCDHACTFCIIPMQEQRFDRPGVFAYSKEKEVPSGSMPDQSAAKGQESSPQ